MPVLTEEAVECARFIEYCEVQVTVLRPVSVSPFGISRAATSGTYPVSDTIGRQWVIIPGDDGLIGSAATQVSIFISTDAAVATLAYGDTALIVAEVTSDTIRVGWGKSGKRELLAALSVDLLKFGQNLAIGFSNAIRTKGQNFSHFIGDLAAFSAFSHKLLRMGVIKTRGSDSGCAPLLFPQ